MTMKYLSHVSHWASSQDTRSPNACVVLLISFMTSDMQCLLVVEYLFDVIMFYVRDDVT